MATNTGLIGTFFFETNNLNLDLKGQFLNYIDYQRGDEIATMQPNSGNGLFAGTYQTTWTEKSGTYTARLIITANNDGYDLVWDQLSPSTKKGFKGIGINYKGTLIGGYWQE